MEVISRSCAFSGAELQSSTLPSRRSPAMRPSTLNRSKPGMWRPGSRALAHAIEERPDALASLAAPAQSWERVAREAFLDGYRDVAHQRGFLPTWREATRLVELFMLEKAFYELGYEMDHRQDWVRIPL